MNEVNKESEEPKEIRPSLPDPVMAFSAIIRDIALVFHLDYRHPTFKKWRDVVATALDLYLGPMHPKTLEFQSIRFKHSDSTEPPEGTPVLQEDELTYSAGLEETKLLLEKARDEVKESAEAGARKAKKLKDAPPEPPPPPPPLEIQITKSNVSKGSIQFDSPAKEKEKTAAAPEPPKYVMPPGGLQIVGRLGSSSGTLEEFMKELDDPREIELVGRLHEMADDPGTSWNDVKTLMSEISGLRRELAQKLFPLILKR